MISINKFFIALAFAAVSTTASAQKTQPVILSFDSDTIVAKDYETTARIHQTNRLGNTYNKYLKRTDPETGEVQRYLLSSKPITGFMLGVGVGGHYYNKNITLLPTLIAGYRGPKWIVEGEGGIGKGKYMDPESDKYKEDYWSVVARAAVRYIVYSSANNNQNLEKFFISVGPAVEYDNRRNSTASVVETATEFTKDESWVQGSSYALLLETEAGITDAKHGVRYSILLYGGVGRDYKNSGTITCPVAGVTLRVTGVFGKTHKTKLGQRILK
jgi:hypothetical protein